MTNHNELEAAFWAKVDAQCAARGKTMTPFAKDVAESVLQAGLLALDDRQHSVSRYNVLAAPTGSGKSSYAWALASALVEADPDSSVVFLCETINQCEDTFAELRKLTPADTVVVWTSGHDATRNPREIEREHGFLPALRFEVEDLAIGRIIVVTHKFFKGPRGHLAQTYAGDLRTLTIIDERPQEVQLYDIELADTVAARDWATATFGNGSTEEDSFLHIWKFLEDAWETERQGRKSYHGLRTPVSDWFFSMPAEGILRQGHGPQSAVIGFARALAQGFAFMSRYESNQRGGRFVGYLMDLPVLPGTLLLDATSDIDGVSQIVDWRREVRSPKASFENLSIVQVTPPKEVLCSKEKVSHLVKSAAKAGPYAEWIMKTIIEQTGPAEKVLVVTHKAMLDHDYLPNNDSLEDGEAFDLSGRRVAFINWGCGIGSNRWKDATTVFLFGEFHVPKRAIMGLALGLVERPANANALRDMQGPKSQDKVLLALGNGHLMRWAKQLAMRGNARNLTEDGQCGKQKLVISGDAERFMLYRETMFPGSVFNIDETSRDQFKGSVAVALLLGEETGPELRSSEVEAKTGVVFRKHGKRILDTKVVKTVMADHGWVYEPGKGRGNQSRFVRMTA